MQIKIGLQECYWQALLYHQEICFKIQDWRELFKKFLTVEVGGLTLETQSVVWPSKDNRSSSLGRQWQLILLTLFFTDKEELGCGYVTCFVYADLEHP